MLNRSMTSKQKKRMAWEVLIAFTVILAIGIPYIAIYGYCELKGNGGEKKEERIYQEYFQIRSERNAQCDLITNEFDGFAEFHDTLRLFFAQHVGKNYPILNQSACYFMCSMNTVEAWHDMYNYLEFGINTNSTHEDMVRLYEKWYTDDLETECAKLKELRLKIDNNLEAIWKLSHPSICMPGPNYIKMYVFALLILVYPVRVVVWLLLWSVRTIKE